MRADPKPAKRPRRQVRVTDRDALKMARIAGTPCAACGSPPGSVHHVIQRGSPHFGDDVPGNLILLCGSGSDRCHGAWHGSPYTVKWDRFEDRRDQEWVATRIGRTIRDRRPDVIEYVLEKLGDDAGRAYLERNYHLVVP